MTIKAVAELAHVSTATVSRVMNGTAKVSPRTAERVERAIKSLNFYPDTNARALGSGRSNLFGLIISDITNPFFPELVKAFEDIAVVHRQDVLIGNTNYDQERMQICAQRMLQRRVDGIAIMTSEMDDKLVKDFSQRGIPLVFLDAATAGPGVSRVQIDYSAGIDDAVEHLIAFGHRRIAFISGPLRLQSAQIRYKAFVESAVHDHLDRDPRLMAEGNHRVDGGHDAMARILASGVAPTAVLASNDLTAMGAMGAIAEAGLRVPEDISVIGYDDIQLSAFTMPPLTTLSLPRADIATAAFRALWNAITSDGKKPVTGTNCMVTPRLVVRGSTGPVKRQKPAKEVSVKRSGREKK